MSDEDVRAEAARQKETLVISRVLNAKDTATLNIGVEAVLKAIRTGGNKLKAQITQIRNRFEAELALTHGDLKAAKVPVEKLKKSLPGVTWSGTFSYRASGKLLQHSGLFCADLDSLAQEELETIRAKLKTSRHLFALFLSPTGNGLKAVFCVPADGANHQGSFRAVEKHVRDLTGIQIDESGKDVSRLCFMSYDPQLFHNPNATELEPLPEPEKPKARVNRSTEGNSKPSKAEVLEMLAVIPKRPHYHDWIKLCAAVGDALPEEDAIEVLNEWSPEEHPGEYARKLASGFEKIHVGTLIHLALQHGWRPKAEARSSGKADDDSTELTSLSSLGAAEYPPPPDQAAYYGLAGEIVRRIAPHTEADPVALLFQLLAAFGNIIGRDAYMLADGARHYLKLFVVLVGKTSKGRKGTAWRHVLNVFRHVDEAWCKNIGHGLSSGEGLIWAVHDKIEGKKLIKEKGKPPEYKTVVTDDGVSEKRLLVIESEFANVLKQGTREGNTLSPVLRSAWEDDNLRTMTKNSPASATGAHITIIGHITREEYRRLLTQTESANGFANRYCNVAVDRSKCLPEGGQAVGIADLVVRLQKAIEFAKNRDELKRDDAARELWAKVYPALSEGKPGLLGAITARAEAQVLRSSGIYALLDCSGVVRVEHLKAALALWDYSERSAAWVFETATGNKNADRILAALRSAGEKGLTKWEITANVFTRNATKHEIDEALRLLHHLELAAPKLEKTAGRPSERWFCQGTDHEVNEESSPR